MDMRVDSHFLKEQRKNRAWSQSELAEMTGLSLRTVQRIEKNGTASLESIKAFAAVFELTPESFQTPVKALTDKTSLTQTPSSNWERFQTFKLSDQAIQISLSIAIPASLIASFLLLSKLPNLDWVHAVRLSLFSEQLPNIVRGTVNITIALLPILFISTCVGFCWDIYTQQGAWHWAKDRLKHRITFRSFSNSIRARLKRGSVLCKKPMLFSLLLLSIATVGIGATMEPYQKANLKRFIAHVLHIDNTPT